MKNKNSTEFLKLDNRYMGVDFTAYVFVYENFHNKVF